ncbi:discoidin domain-containing protein [Sedimentisphaera salicampi]|uniref:discoidin domain-containing protein n=1 Tax=Sedimentisphaera salicampi TaxID=1941349 RepID=UPI000B9BECA3|nr:discoidin domain-containing protein [Sedimentisphaera salicampi]OXU14329.1 Beta-galactosidase [Sedimentisphaera salicampi]
MKFFSAAAVLLTAVCMNAQTIDLSGQWRFSLDEKDAGVSKEWFAGKLPGDDKIQLPGAIQSQGYGEDPGPDTDWVGDVRQDVWDAPKYKPYRTEENFKFPFFLQPDKYYKGASWQQKTVTIPQDWQGKHITLTLERPHWETTVWVDSKRAGSCDYLSIPHRYDLSELLTPGRHRLTIRVDNRMIVDVGHNSHSVTDHTQSNWNGIVGSIKLSAEEPVFIEDLQVYPDIDADKANVKIAVKNNAGISRETRLNVKAFYKDKLACSESKKLELTGKTASAEIILSGLEKRWDEFNPNLYRVEAELKAGKFISKADAHFGMREIETRGSKFYLNDRHIFFRGTLECCIFPKTGYPPTTTDEWERIIKICKAHGLNHIRFHSWCPPEAAFKAADKLGFYYQVECSSWANQSTKLGVGLPIDEWIYDEADAVLKEYGNHPSFILFAYGNEPGGPQRGGKYLKDWVNHYKQKDSRRLVTSAAGWPVIEQNQFHVTHHNVRIQGWGEELNSRINSKPPETQTDYSKPISKYSNTPIISHEIGQWCVYPNFDEIKKYDGYLKPKNFEVFRDLLKDKGMLEKAEDFLMASGKLQTLCYKEDIESALRTEGFGGFQLLDLHDFPGQGTALVGVLDPFWDSKPYVSPEEYRQFSGAIVPLARMAKRTFTTSGTFNAQIDVSHFGADNLNNVKLHWSLENENGKVFKKGVMWRYDMPAGGLYTFGDISFDLAGIPAPSKYTLKTEIEGTKAKNSWDIWVYPEEVKTENEEVLQANSLNPEVLEHLSEGGNVLLEIDTSLVKTDVELGFSSIFWNTAWTQGQAPHTLGILCDPQHPALKHFPTEYHSSWQWSLPIQNAAAMKLERLPEGVEPIVQIVPDWFAPEKLGIVFEAKVGSGKILAASVDMTTSIDKSPSIRQLKASLLSYMGSDKFSPEVSVSAEQIQKLFRDPGFMDKAGAEVVKTNSAHSGRSGSNVLDGKPSTIWHTSWGGGKIPHPHEIHLKIDYSAKIKGLTILPRQDGNTNGYIKKCSVYAKQSGSWGKPVWQGSFKRNMEKKLVSFDKPVKAKYFRIVSEEGFAGEDYTSIAEIKLLPAE